MEENKSHWGISCLFTVTLGVAVFLGLFYYFSLRGTVNANRTAAGLTGDVRITVIAAPTLTPTVYATREPLTLDIRYISENGLSVGTLVEIYGTEDTGLSVRPQPGTGGYLNFVAREGERFMIVDGPDSRNDYIWWKLESVSDPERNGWAAGDYLKPVEDR